MTLTSMVRPLQKGVGRLLLAGTNSAVVSPNSVDVIRDTEQPAPPSDAGSPMHAASAMVPSVPEDVPAPAPAEVWGRFTPFEQKWCNIIPEAAAAQEPSKPPASELGPCPGLWVTGDQPWRWGQGFYMVPTMVFSDTISEAPSTSCGASTVGSTAGVLPGRTGASRRQRRRQQQQQQLLQQHEKSGQKQGQQPQFFGMGGGGNWQPAIHFDAEWSQFSAWPASPAEASPTDQETSVGSKSVDASAVVSASASDAKETVDEPGSDEMLLFPATPENTPPASPRFMCSNEPQGQPGFLLDFGQVMPAAAMPMEYFEPYDVYEQRQPQPSRPRPARAAAAAEEVISPPDAECERALEQLNMEDERARAEALAWVVDRAWPLATSASGCRTVQRALDLASEAQRLSITEQMRGRILEAATSPHANHVLQKCVELVPTERLQFVLDEIRGEAVVTARHRFGCRVLERLIEKCPASQTEPLLEEVLTGAAQLCRHTFGNFVVQHVLEHGTVPQRRAIAEMLYTDIQRLARHRVASHVVRAALVHCAPEDRQQLIAAIRADAAELADLAHHHCGSFVVREMRREMRR